MAEENILSLCFATSLLILAVLAYMGLPLQIFGKVC